MSTENPKVLSELRRIANGEVLAVRSPLLRELQQLGFVGNMTSNAIQLKGLRALHDAGTGPCAPRLDLVSTVLAAGFQVFRSIREGGQEEVVVRWPYIQRSHGELGFESYDLTTYADVRRFIEKITTDVLPGRETASQSRPWAVYVETIHVDRYRRDMEHRGNRYAPTPVGPCIEAIQIDSFYGISVLAVESITAIPTVETWDRHELSQLTYQAARES